MPTLPIEAATARVACALCSQTGLVTMSNIDRVNCTFDINPPDALIDPHTFADYQIDDLQMAAVVERMAVCSPEASVQTAVRNFPPIPAATRIMLVIGLLEALIAAAPEFTGECMTGGCCR